MERAVEPVLREIDPVVKLVADEPYVLSEIEPDVAPAPVLMPIAPPMPFPPEP